MEPRLTWTTATVIQLGQFVLSRFFGSSISVMCFVHLLLQYFPCFNQLVSYMANSEASCGAITSLFLSQWYSGFGRCAISILQFYKVVFRHYSAEVENAADPSRKRVPISGESHRISSPALWKMLETCWSLFFEHSVE